MRCRICGDKVDPRRAELGYDYCTKPACQERCVEHVRLASIGVNKSNDYYVRADDVLPPPRPDRTDGPHRPDHGQPPDEDDGDDAGSSSGRSSAVTTTKVKKRAPSTLERLQRMERDLDATLDRSYERFLAGELTARELDRERDRLIAAFNRTVMADNIRYRSLLRKP
jgi:hypothetical protein